MVPVLRDSGPQAQTRAGLSPTDWGRLAGFVQDAGGHPRFVLLVQDLEVPRSYRVMRMPSYVLLDSKGVVSWVADGVISRGELVLSVRAALTRAH